MHEEYKRALQWVINHCTNEAQTIYCSTDGRLSDTQYARIAAYEDVVKSVTEELEHGSAKEDCSH